MLDKAKITPEVLLLELADRLMAMENMMRREEPEGDIVSTVVSVSTVPVEVNLGRWLKANLYNNLGGQDVYVYNTRQVATSRDAGLKAGENLIVDHKRVTDRRFYLVCLAGTATVRIFFQ